MVVNHIYFIITKIMSEEKPKLQTNDTKTRFRRNNKVFFNCDRVENISGHDKASPIHKDPEKFQCRGESTSIFAFLNVELTRGYELEHDEERFSARREKVYSFMKIPREVEKFMLYGIMQCTDSFLFVYTFLPLRALLAIFSVIARPFKTCFGLTRYRRHNRTKHSSTHSHILTPAEICDLLKVTIIVLCAVLLLDVDTNMLYHLIKSQSVIKLYIFYNMLEVGDRLFSAFGQDIIDALFWTATEPRDRKRQHLGTVPHLVFALIYVFLHSLLVLLQATTLNVAINSSNKSLLTIMISNNFVELKGSVFKKFDKNNLFQVSCSDVRERFHHVVLLFIVVVQTLKEYSWTLERFFVLVPDCLTVFACEIIVDWIKHAFITRFNELQEDVYRDYTTSLAYDVAQSRQKHAFSDHSDLVARRMGFIPLPLGVVMVRVLFTSISITDIPSVIILFIVFLCVCSLRILNGILILGSACKLISAHKMEKGACSNVANASNRSNWLNYKDIATSPLKPASTLIEGNHEEGDNMQINKKVGNKSADTLKSHKAVDGLKETSDLFKESTGLSFSTAIFANSTVDLNDITLNDELLKVVECSSGDLLETLDDGFSKSDPIINKKDLDEQDLDPVDIKAEIGFKRAESEPNLVNCAAVIADEDS